MAGMVPSLTVRAARFLPGCAGLVGLVVGVGLAVWVVLWISLRSSAVRVPAVVGQDLATAAATLQDVGLVGRVQEGVFSRDMAIGRIAVQRPGPGLQLKRGAAILLYPSLGEEVRRVPELRGLPLALAQVELESSGLFTDHLCEVEGEGDSVTVIGHSPAAGTQVAPASRVTLLVNRVPRQRRYVMPDLYGVTEDGATRTVRALGFQLATVQPVPYPGVPAGIVLRQSPAAGEAVAEAAVVALWVSR
ncbi:MAG: PASTA domain-containing protein [Thermoanaerobaculaceae bacterium]|nr:PASTA domain-containing protein [Thermoanaerobaculaceae bacterium]MDI9620835.1 PASTA domain-containing protein [Acidobacteriota bacterium]NLH12572.1 PASTA domain-containing protein [Holophagae bacterium]